MTTTKFESQVNISRFASDNFVNCPGFGQVFLLQFPDLKALLRIVLATREDITIIFPSIYNVRHSLQQRTVCISFTHERKYCNFLLEFSDPNSFQGFIKIFFQLLMEMNLLRPLKDEDYYDLNQRIISTSNDQPNLQPTVDELNFEHEQDSYTPASDKGKNILLTTAPDHKASLVIREYDTHSDLGVFELGLDCKFLNSSQNLRSDSNLLNVSQILLHNQENHLLMLDAKKSDHIFSLDLEKGAIVNSYQASAAGKTIPIKNIFSISANQKDVPFLAVSDRDSFLFDPRQGNDHVNRSEYKTKNGFTCGATSPTGKVAIGDQNGVVRLYTEPCSGRAKTNVFANAGESITHVEVSFDEQWVLTTSAKSISVFSIVSPSTGKTGFVTRLGQEKQPVCQLTLNPNHEAKLAELHGGELPPFGPAKFDMKNGKIVSIIAGIGRALVFWDFNRIEKGYQPAYRIFLVNDNAVNDQEAFPFSDDVLFISDNNVATARRIKGKK